MNLVEEAYKELFGKAIPYTAILEYSGRFKGYNANIKLRYGILTLCMSKQWKGVSREIQIGLVQELMVKIFKKRQNTMHMDLYNHFIKKVHLAVPKTKRDNILESSFLRINEGFFSGIIDLPNFQWSNSANKLGSYDFGTDTVTISSALKEDLELLDYVMYHELLHKKLKFKSRYGRTRSHTALFRTKEKLFPNQAILEKRLHRICRKQKLKRMFGLI